LTSSGGEENDDEDVTFSEPPLDDEDGEPLTRPSSGFSPSPQPLTSTQKPQGQRLGDKKTEQNQTGKIHSISLERSWPGSLCCVFEQESLKQFPLYLCTGHVLSSVFRCLESCKVNICEAFGSELSVRKLYEQTLLPKRRPF